MYVFSTTKYVLDIEGEETRNHSRGVQGRYSGTQP